MTKPRDQDWREDDEDADDDGNDNDEDNGEEEEDAEPSQAERLTYSGRDAWAAIKHLGKFLFPYLARRRGLFLLLLAGVAVETAFNVAFPLSLKYLIDSVLDEGKWETLVVILAVLGGLGFIASVVMVASEWLNARLCAEAVAAMRQELFDHIHRVALGFYDRMKSGQILSRFSSDMSSIDDLVMNGVDWGFLPLLELIAAMGLLFYLSPEMALLATIIFPLALIGPRLVAPRAADANYQLNRRLAGALAVVGETLGAQPLIRAFSLQRQMATWHRERNALVRQMTARVRFLDALMERSVTISVLLLHLMIFGVGAVLTFQGTISIGTFVAFEAIFWELSYNVVHVTQFIPDLVESAGALRHIDEFLGEPERSADAPGAVWAPRLQSQIRFENLSFSYAGETSQLVDLSLTIPAGSRVAVVGESGAGKSTLLALLLRLHEPSAGRISLDGVDLQTISRESLRRQMAIVFQDNILFGTTIRENIRLGRGDATDAEIRAAAKEANIHAFIMTLPQRYETVVGERGSTLSGGQRQRLAIARAVVRDPAILLLDEATSALDPATEASVVKTLARVSRGRTLVTVTHRLTSVVDYDEIFVLENGRLAQQGRHKDLVELEGPYRRLWNEQSLPSARSSRPLSPRPD